MKKVKRIPKDVISTCLIILFTLLLVASTNAQRKFSAEEIAKIKSELYEIKLTGDAFGAFQINVNVVTNIPQDQIPIKALISSIMNYHVSGSQNSLNITLVPTSLKTYYDLQSNASPMQIIQDPLTPNHIHAIFTVALQTNFSDRRVRYAFSGDAGSTWIDLGIVTVSATSGFGAISVLSDGNAIIGLHSNIGGNPNRTQFFVDVFPGLGSFNRYDPGIVGETYGKIWPKFTPIAGTNTVSPGFVWVSSINGQDSTFRNRFFNNTYIGYQEIQANPGEANSVARGQDGRIGILYQTKQDISLGSIEFIESRDNGVTWTNPLRIFETYTLPGPAFLHANLRGLQLVYQGNTPAAVFELVAREPTGQYYPSSIYSEIRFWSPALPGNDPNKSMHIAVLDTLDPVVHPLGVPFAPNLGVNDVLANLCRPTIGVSSDGTAIFVGMVVASDFTGGASEPTSYRDVYFSFSSDGLLWPRPIKVTPDSPRRDWLYPSISPSNVNSSTDYIAYMSLQSDSIPGSFINGQGNGPSLAQQIVMKISTPRFGGNPSSPVLLLPLDGAVNLPTPILLKWRPVLNANSYQLQVSLSPTFAQLFVDEILDVSEFELNNSGNMLPNTTYYWKVRSTNVFGTSTWSPTNSFTTGIITGLEPTASELPNEYNLYNNYPNPFNPKTSIKFDIKEDGLVTLKVYDLLGREISIVVNQNLQSGRYEINFNSEGLASGIYFYTLSVNDFKATKKMLLTK